MWKRFADILRCPKCKGKLSLHPINEERVPPDDDDNEKAELLGLSSIDISEYINTGILLCDKCRTWYPVYRGLPVMLAYKTQLYDEFIKENKTHVDKISDKYSIPCQRPPKGEEFVAKTFSREWLDYEYDNVLWTWTYEQREKIFLNEINYTPEMKKTRMFLEVGCGLGLVTSFAEKHLQCDAVGVDLGLAALKAGEHFKMRPFMHFVQASVWNLPFEENLFDYTYSHGVLHHTYSTEKALESLVRYCKPGGSAYIWIYAKKSINESLSRRLAYAVEVITRPIFARLPSGMTEVLLMPFVLAYIIINKMQIMTGENRQSYNYSRALHAARDRLTPLYAHRATFDEAKAWFEKFGFESVSGLDNSKMPEGMNAIFERHLGIRGRKKLSHPEEKN